MSVTNRIFPILAAVLLAVPLLMGQQYNVPFSPRASGASGIAADWTEDFASTNQTEVDTDWVGETGQHAQCRIALGTSPDNFVNVGSQFCTRDCYYRAATSGGGGGSRELDTISHWLCAKVEATGANYAHLMLRQADSSGSSYRYLVGYDVVGTEFEWRSANGGGTFSAVIDTSIDMTVNANDFVCALVTGTSTSTQIEIWVGTSAFGDYDNATWDAAVKNTCGGGTDPCNDTLTVVTAPGTYADTGKYVGLQSNDCTFFDDVSAGDTT